MKFPFTMKLPIALTKLPASPLNIIKYETNSEKIIFTVTKAFSILFIQTPIMVSLRVRMWNPTTRIY